MPSNAITNLGLLLKRGDGAGPEVFVTIGELVEVTPPGIVNPAFEKTTQASTAREYGSTGLVEVEEFTCTINYIPSQTDHGMTSGLAADVKSGAQRNYQLAMPDAGPVVWSFAALVTGFKVQTSNSQSPEGLRAEVTFRPTGNIIEA